MKYILSITYKDTNGKVKVEYASDHPRGKMDWEYTADRNAAKPLADFWRKRWLKDQSNFVSRKASALPVLDVDSDE